MKRRLEDNRVENSSGVASVYPQQRRITQVESLPHPSTPNTFQRVTTPHPQSAGVNSFPCTKTEATVKSESGLMQTTLQPFSIQQYSTPQSGLQGGIPNNHSLHSLSSLPSQPHIQQLRPKAPGIGMPGLSGSNTAQHQFHRLKVEDALSYLDQVKFRFTNHPQVYNDFLDIMKEFKSQSIDTPGVINRVSTLFKGHPELIVGFNTFLPPGYKIEVHGNDVSISSPGQPLQTVVHTPPPPPPPPAPCTHVTSRPIPVTSPLVNRTPVNAGTPSSPSVVVTTVSSTSQLSVPNPSTTVVTSLPAQPQSQPVEFNHAINYVNKIKNRFQAQPDIYKQFLEILHTYQKEQRCLKEGSLPAAGKTLTEAEVYAQVAKLFQNQEDLLLEFGQFLPDATNGTSTLGDAWNSLKCNKKVVSTNKIVPIEHNNSKKSTTKPISSVLITTPNVVSPVSISKPMNQQIKRAPQPVHPPAKKIKLATLKDVSLAEAGKVGTLNEYAFFDKVRKALRSTEVYENFLRCLVLYNQEVVSRSELVLLVQPFLGRYPELLKWFKDFVGFRENSYNDPMSNSINKQERVSAELATEIDYSSCKRLGASYCALPKTYMQPKCSGRTMLCKEVLNDTWVSFPSWSEDSTFVTSRKTAFEEYIYRCEDERFELDVVLETNLATIRVLEGVQKKLSRLPPEEVNKFKLDDCLGGTSAVIHQRAIRRIYGDKANDIVDGLKKNPSVSVPIVLRRLKAKEEEWREAQKSFNKIWREQNEKYYLKSLDHQGINFKQLDMKALRSKNLYNEIETLYEERHEQAEEGAGDVPSGPHMSLPYKDKSVLDDAAHLLIHHVKRQTISKEEKQKIKQLLRQFVPDLFQHARQELSDDEKEDDDEEELSKGSKQSPDYKGSGGSCKTEDKGGGGDARPNGTISNGEYEGMRCDLIWKLCGVSNSSDECYTLFLGNNYWYLFLRLHQILCERLAKIYEQANILIREESKERMTNTQSTAVALRLKPKSEIEVQDYYPTFLDMVRNLLDGNMDANTYEDTLRDMFGIHAYIAFTMDKVVSNAVRQLQYLVSDKSCAQCTELFQQETKLGGTGGHISTAHQRTAQEHHYQRKAEQLLSEENCFKFYIFKQDCHMTVELLDTESEDSETRGNLESWNQALDKYLDSNDGSNSDIIPPPCKKPLFLSRNIRSFKKFKDSDLTRSSRYQSPCQIADNLQCKFNVNSYKMSYVVNTQSCMYRRRALLRARKCHKAVTLKLNSQFKQWHMKWLKINVGDKSHALCSDWFMGCVEGVVSHRTILLTDNDVTFSPYTPYNRYKVQYLPDD